MAEQSQDPRLRSLLRMTREVTARRDLDDVLTQAFLGLRTMVSFGGGCIQLIDEDGWITVAACDPPAPPDVMERRIPLGTSVAGRVILTEQSIYVPDATADSRTLLSPGTEWTADVRTYLAVPLLVDGRAIGVLRVDDARPSAFTESDQLLIATAAAVIAAAIQNARADARVGAARKRREVLENRERQVRELIAASRAAKEDDPDRLRELLDVIEQTLVDPAGDVDLREGTRHLTT
jgi:GAF domain-containing protein